MEHCPVHRANEITSAIFHHMKLATINIHIYMHLCYSQTSLIQILFRRQCLFNKLVRLLALNKWCVNKDDDRTQYNKIMQFHRMPKLQFSKCGDGSPAFSTFLNLHQHLTCQPSTALLCKIESVLA